MNGYKEVAEQIVEWVSNEQLPDGTRLPSERQFQLTLDVSRPTINKAIACLIAQGRLRREGYKLYTTLSVASILAPVIHVLHPHHQSQASAMIRERLIEAAHDVAAGFQTHIIPVLSRNAEQQRTQLAQLLAGECAGFILWPIPGAKLDDLLKQATARGVRFVVCDQDMGHDCLVTTDHRAGSAMAVDHLHALGHRRIVYVTQSLAIGSLRERCEGYRQRCESLGIDESAKAVIEIESLSSDDVLAAWRQLRRDHRSATAVFCSNDLIAMQLLDLARDARIAVPSRLSVMGFDDIEEAAFTVPPLTTISQDFYQLGVLATQTLYQRLRTAAHNPLRLRPTRLRLEPMLIRETSSVAAVQKSKRPRMARMNTNVERK